MPSLATALGQELARLLEPLTVAAGSAERWPLVLGLIGHTAAVAADPALRAALDELGALANLGDVDLESWDGIEAILGAAARATKALHEIEQAAADPALAERLKQLGRELAEQLTAVYLRRFHGRLFRFAAIVGIVEPAESHPPRPAQFDGDVCVRSAWSADELHFERIGPLLRDPFGVLRAIYLPNDLRTAADAHAAADRVFPLLRAALDELGLPSRTERRSLLPDDPADPGEGDHFDSPRPAPEDEPPIAPIGDLAPYYRTTEPRLAIRIPQLQADGALAGTFLGIDLVASSLEHPGAFAGLIVALTGALNWTQTRGGWAMQFATDGEVPAFAIGPQGMKLAALSSAAAGASGRLSIARVDDGAPAFAVGDPKGTRLELGKVEFGIDFAATPAHVGAGLSIAVDKAVLALGGGDGDGFIAKILPADGLKAEFDFGISLSSDKGLALRGSAGMDVTIPVGLTLAGISFKTLTLAIRFADGRLGADATASLSAVIGPVQAAVDGFGLGAALTFPDGGGNLGVADLSIGFQPPLGIGAALDAGLVTGGGFIKRDPALGLYAGVLQLSIHEQLTLTAFGLIATQLPGSEQGSRGYSLAVFITAEGFQPIQLGLGFTLSGIGGMVAIHRTFDENVLRAGLRNDTLGALLFPRNPIANAPALIQALNGAFPARQGSYLVGLLVKIGWFTPTLVTLDLALILEFGARKRLLVLGRIAALLPAPDNDLVRLILDAMGVLDFDQGTASIDAVLVDSRLVHKFALTGAMALRARWSSPGAGFILAVGGVNPHFAPPEALPPLERVAIALSSGANPRLTCAAYFALTSNTLQFGAAAQLYAAAYGFSIQGDIGFDVLIQIVPLHFLAEFRAGVQLQHGSSNLFKVSVDGALEGPKPLRVSGKASFEIFWCDFTVRFDKTLVEGEQPSPPPAIDVLGQLQAALASPQSWRAERAAGHTQGVALKALQANTLVLDPLGRLQVRQQLVPLNTGRELDRFGGAPIAGPKRFNLTASLSGSSQHTETLQEQFAPAQFFAMSDDEKLAAPSFESMDAGIAFGDHAASFDQAQAIAAPLAFEPILVDDLAAPPPPPSPPPQSPKPVYPLPLDRLQRLTSSGAAGKAPLRRSGLARFKAQAADDDSTSSAVTLAPLAWRLAPLADGAAAPPSPGVQTYSEHLAALARINRSAAPARVWQIVPAFELAQG